MYYQLPTVENITQFLITLLLVLDKKHGNCNTFFVQSPPNSGKNLFFDCFCFSFGQIGTFNKYSNFPLMEYITYNNRVLLWNEPQCESGSFETLKMLFKGDTCNIKIKYENDAILSKTPIIILANYDPFPKDVAHRTRIIKYFWNTMDNLINCNMKLYPLAFHHVLQ